MSLKETYFENLRDVKKMDPDAVIIDVTRMAGSVLSPYGGYCIGAIPGEDWTKSFLEFQVIT